MAESTAPAIAESPRPFESFLNLEFGRQLGLMVGLAASIAIGVGVALWLVVEKDYKPLYASLERIDAGGVVSVLEAASIDYRIDQRSGALLVDAAKIHQARMELASAGMPLDQNAGFELLDKEQPLGTSQFMENARFRRGLEGELARTISSIAAVRAARVHLAIPKSTVFLRDARQPRASVFVEVYRGVPLQKEQIRAIANLVVSSVPDLSLRSVTVVDQRGNLLSDFEQQDPRYAEAARQLDYNRQIENDLLQRINSLLEPIVGAEKFRAEVAVDLDFTRVEQTAEIYNPDLPAIRSEQTTSEQTQAAAQQAEGVPGAVSNQPPETGQLGAAGGATGEGAAGAAPTRSKVFETRNFELDRTISHTQHQIGQIKLMTVAVAVDDLKATASEDAEVSAGAKVAWPAADLERLTALVQNAVGFDASRGDRVSVINTPFLREEIEPLPEVVPKMWEQAWFWNALKMALGVLAFIIVIFMVLRPTMKRLTENSKKIKELELRHQQALDAVNEVAAGGEATISADGEVTLTGASKNLLPSPADRLDDQITMVKDMVNEDPDRVAQVIQGWAGKDE
ncbi:MAG: flagellar M-ring protein FliF [Pseudomonadales bacterium]|nr:flagellar M-ring protein FliF [Pseudomonadales bacterium]